MNPPRNNAAPTAPPRSRNSSARWPRIGLAAITLLLMLCCAGCRSWSEYAPSVHTGPLGNAVAATLPPGTRVVIAADPPRSSIAQAFTGSITVGRDSVESLLLTAPLILVTPAWIAERDARELELHRKLSDLKNK